MSRVNAGAMTGISIGDSFCTNSGCDGSKDHFTILLRIPGSGFEELVVKDLSQLCESGRGKKEPLMMRGLVLDESAGRTAPRSMIMGEVVSVCMRVAGIR